MASIIDTANNLIVLGIVGAIAYLAWRANGLFGGVGDVVDDAAAAVDREARIDRATFALSGVPDPDAEAFRSDPFSTLKTRFSPTRARTAPLTEGRDLTAAEGGLVGFARLFGGD